MRRRHAYVLGSLAAAGLAAALAVGCSQKEGQRCEVTSDCSGDLVCNKGTGTCQNPASAGVDANFNPDTRLFDAAVPDAPPADAPTDAPIDAP
jgi:hypothetical protein